MQDTLLSGSAYRLKMPQFEGPLDLLLDFIEKRKMHIVDISLAQVADDYIAYIRTMEHFPIGDVAHFLVIAATLVLIKSKSILPQMDLTDEEEVSIDELKRRLMMLEKFREVAATLRGEFLVHPLFYRMPQDAAPVFAPHQTITIQSVRDAMRQAITALPKQEQLPRAVVKKVISIEEMMDRLAGRIQRALKMSFKEFAGHKGRPATQEEKVHIVVGFLAMLELVKQGVLHVTQETGFGDIHMESQDLSTPSYGDPLV